MFARDVEKTPAYGQSSVEASEEPQVILNPTISNTNAPPPPVFDPDNFNPPDGGFRAWSQVFAGMLINCLAWGYPATFGVYQLHYEETLGLPSSQISWIGSCQTFLTFAFCGPAGRLADAGYTRETVLVGSVLAVLGSFMTSLCTEYWQIFLAQGVCTGIGLALIFMPAVSVVSSYFKAKKAFALAVAAMGTGVGAIVFPATLQYLIPQIGFPWAVRCAAFVALTMAIIANIILKPCLPPRRSGPLVEWDAFRELPYLFFSLGAFLNFYALYFGFFYVSHSPFVLAYDPVLTKDPRKMGTRFGMVQTICAFASLAGAPTAGAIIDKSGGDFVWAQVWGGTVLLMGASMVMASRIASSGWVLFAKI
ncbi:hypothetical protein CDV31_009129 [Fusarium ambrosium]|uniref:Major facilitator superfamily (MFS) profile domain-containing protein n=1 Tax=Fusarium ambrosium TaxID=131363 RepID=A0A428TWY9_9HYPO|nr:hypothetical protein CDV31_009129 [Fusarium ambrosium]